MADVIFTSGKKIITLKDEDGHSVDVGINPYDAKFLLAIMDCAEKLDAEQSKLNNAIKGVTDWKALYGATVKADEAMRELIDGLFHKEVCSALFPDVTVYALADGLPIWANLLYAMTEQMDIGLADEKAKAQERIRKYSAKWKK